MKKPLKRFSAYHKISNNYCEFEYTSLKKAIEKNPDFKDWKEIPKRDD